MELLAPAGSYQSLVAAVEAGADAVYTGGKQFSARRQAQNLDSDEMMRAVEYCHLRDRKLYVTVNTLIADTEMQSVLAYVFQLQEQGIDGVIIQDLGLMQACRRIFPDLRLHASTQMSIHNQLGVQWAQEQGIKRAVLARELSKAEVKLIKQHCPDMELEIFVHGALCFSFSGQCLFSSLVGGRSGNRGNCAQPCRLPYILSGNKTGRQQLPGQHLLSPADLRLLPFLSEVEAAGVTSLKIEGRMKRPEYVATVTRIYRQAIDQGGRLDDQELQQAEQELTAAFNRNFTHGFWHGKATDYLSPQRPNNRGSLIGRITSVKAGMSTIALKESLRLGDGLEVWTSSGSNAVTVVRSIMLDGHPVTEAPGGTQVAIELDGVGTGDRVFKTSDAALIEQALGLGRENRQPGRRPVAMTVKAFTNNPLIINLTDLNSGLVTSRSSADLLSAARREATTREQITDKIGELGDTALALQDLTVEVDGECLVPFSWVKEIRRQATEGLKQELLDQRMPRHIKKEIFEQQLKAVSKISSPRKMVGGGSGLLTVAVDSVDTAKAALVGGADRVYLNLSGSKGNQIRAREWDELLQLRQHEQRVMALLPRIMLPGDQLPDLTTGDGIVVTNPGWIKHNARIKLGDYTLNGYNSLSLRYLLDQGLDMVCTSLELNLQQIKALAGQFPGQLECVVHGDIPITTSRFCLLGYSVGSTECQGCSRPCRQDDYYLEDRKGYKFPLRTDQYGRFYLFNSRTLCAVEEVGALIDSGIGALRLQLSLIRPQAVKEITAIYRQVIDQPSNRDFAAVKERLRHLAPSDFTKLHYYRGVI